MAKRKGNLLATRLLLSLLVLFTASTAWADITGSGTEADPYVLSTIDDWNTFAANVNDGMNADNYYKLSDSWNNSSNGITTMVGTSEHPFSGTFDGNGKTLTLNLSATTDNCAPFEYMNNASIKKLTIAGSVTTSAKFGASLASHSSGTTRITDCHSTATIKSTVIYKDGTHGGFVAVNENGATLSFERCSFKGKMLGEEVHDNGGFVGWTYSTVSYTDCLFAPAELTMGTINTCTFNRNGNNSFTRTYYTTAFGQAQGTKVMATAPEGQVSMSMTLADGETYYRSVTISGMKEYYMHTGDMISIDYTVTAADGTTLTKGTDYTETFSPATVQDNGAYTLTITGQSPYVGSQTFNFTVIDPPSVTSSTTTFEDGYTYKVDSNVEVSSRITVNGNATLLLCDGYTLTASEGIEVSQGNTLTINGEAQNTGKLISTGYKDKETLMGHSGIGAMELGTIIINGGTIEATGGVYAAGIGGSQDNNDSGVITINGGIVKATGGVNASGIGGGDGSDWEKPYGNCPTIKINGGQVTATGGTSAPGIGPGFDTDDNTSGSLTLGWTNETDFIQVTGQSSGNYCGFSNRISSISLAGKFAMKGIGTATVTTIKGVQSLKLEPVTDDLNKKLEYATVTGIHATYDYTGSEITVEPWVKDAVGNNLANGAHYTVKITYEGNSTTSVKAIGNYTLTITSTGYIYTGSQTVNFSVQMPAPTNLRQTAYTANSATLTWVQRQSAVKQWRVEYSTQSDFSSNVTKVTVNEKTYTLTNLTPETSYYVRVTAVIGNVEKTSSTFGVIATERKWVGINSEWGKSQNYPLTNALVRGVSNQIFTPDEIGGQSVIRSLAFCNTSDHTTQRDIDIYMVHTKKNSFDGDMDWIGPTAADMVFSGIVTFNGNHAWTTITLDKPFAYNGNDNLVIITDDNTASYDADLVDCEFLTYSTSTNQGMYTAWNGSDLNPSSMGVKGFPGPVKNQILIDIAPALTLSDNADNTSSIAAHHGESLIVTLQDRTLYRDGSWNTLCLPFSLSAEQIADSPLAGVTIKELDGSTSNLNTEGLLTLNFTDATAIEAGKPYIVKWAPEVPTSTPIFNPADDVITALNFISEVPDYDNGQATNWLSKEGPASLVDGDTGTKYGLDGNEPWVEFHYANAITPKGYALWTANDENGKRNPKNWTIKAKVNSDDDWTTLVTLDNSNGDKLPMANNQRTIFALDNEKAYQYFRFEATRNDSGKFQLAELQFCTMQRYSNIVNPVFEGVTISANAPQPVTGQDGTVSFKGIYDSTPLAKDVKTNLYLGADNMLYYPNVEGISVGAFRAYFQLTDASANVNAIRLNFGDGETTSIRNVHSSINVQSEAWFSLDGRKLDGKPTQRGVYINNGKKIVIK